MRPASLILSLSLLVLLTACSRLTAENYARIKTGMTLSEVSAILGKPERCSELLGLMTCNWGDEKRSIQVNFVGDQVVLTKADNIR